MNYLTYVAPEHVTSQVAFCFAACNSSYNEITQSRQRAHALSLFVTVFVHVLISLSALSVALVSIYKIEPGF